MTSKNALSDNASIEWLKARLRDKPREYAEGFVDGYAVAMCFGHAARCNLQIFRAESNSEEWNALFAQGPHTEFAALKRLYFLMEPSPNGDPEDFDVFLDDFLVDTLGLDVGESGEYARGFAQGCLEHWAMAGLANSLPINTDSPGQPISPG